MLTYVTIGTNDIEKSAPFFPSFWRRRMLPNYSTIRVAV